MDDQDRIQPVQVPSLPQHLLPIAAPSALGNSDTPVSAIWRVGDVILDQYQVTAILGEGGMGTVYKVHHHGWNSDLAVKSPKPHIFARAKGKEDFTREAETWVNLGLHRHIVSCYYVRTLGGIPRVFAEYVAGGSLSDWISTRRLYIGGHKRTLERVLDIAIQFAWGLHYAHEKGLVHQDVKPANVMMTIDGIAKVTDFGLAQARMMTDEVAEPGHAGQSIVVPGIGLMTQAYASPEQMQGKPLTRKTDIWSWGVSVLEMFVGEVTWFAGRVAREALASHEGQDPTIPPMPAQIVKLLNWCFQQRPEERPPTMRDVATALQTIYTDLIGIPYPRDASRSAKAVADSLNNQALSLLDLGNIEAAKQVWQQALQADPYHLEATYNQGLVLWRQGALTDNILVRQMEELWEVQGKSWQTLYLLALIHLERGDGDEALRLLKQIAPQTLEETEVQVLLKQMQSGTFSSGHHLSVLTGMISNATTVSLSADGKFILSGKHDHTVRLWEVASENCLRTFTGHTNVVTSVSLSADGNVVLSGSADMMVRLWEVASGHCLHAFIGHKHIVTSVSLSADGSLALSGSEDGTIRLWEAASGRCLRIFTGHTDGVTSVGLSANGSIALSGSWDTTVRLWETASGRCLRTFIGHKEGVTSVDLSPTGDLALSGSSDGTVRLWETATTDIGRCLRLFWGKTSPVTSVSLRADGRAFLSGDSDFSMRLWEVATGRCLCTWEGYRGDENAVRTLVSLSADGSIALFAHQDGYAVHVWGLPHEHFFCPVRLSQVRSHADATQLEARASGLLRQAEDALTQARFAQAFDLIRQVRALPGWERSPKSMQAWKALLPYSKKVSLRSGWLVRSFYGYTARMSSVSISTDGSVALSGSGANTVQLWEVATGRCLRNFLGHEYSETSVGNIAVCLGAAGDLALSGGWDSTVRLWEVATGHCLRIFPGHEDGVTTVSLSTDGRFALSGSRDNTVRLWEVTSGRCLRIFTGHTDEVTSVSLSADGGLALSGSRDNTVRLWEVSSGHCLRIFTEHTSPVTSVSLGIDGSIALSGSEDKTMRLWEVPTGRPRRTGPLPFSIDGPMVSVEERSRQSLRVFTGHEERVTSVCLSADGRFAVSGSEDNTVRVWEVSTGRCLRTFTIQERTMAVPGVISAVSLSTDGSFFLSVNGDNTVGVWELDWELEARELTHWDEHISRYARFSTPAELKDHVYIASESSAQPFLYRFLTQHMPYAGSLPQGGEPSEPEIQSALTRWGRPSWSEQDFQGLLRHLRYVGYGWLRPEEVRAKLEHMASDDWDQIQVELEQFLVSGSSKNWLGRWKKPEWDEMRFQIFCEGLSIRYPWLRSDGVRLQLDQMASHWQGPLPLTKREGKD